MPETEEAQQAEMAAWGAWFGEIGARVIDGGNPVGPSTTVASDGSVANDGGANPATRYGLFEAKDLDEAIEIARGCPLLKSGGSVELAVTFEP